MNTFAKFLGIILRVLKTPLKQWSQAQKLTAVITGLSVILAGLGTTALVLHSDPPEIPETTPSTTEPVVTTTEPVQTTTEAPTTDATTEPTTVPTESVPVVNDKVLELQEMLKKNPETFGWIYLPGTKIDEVVMYSPDRPDFYLYQNYNGWFSAGGTAYIDEICSVDPESQVLQIYSHNMLNGTHFGTLSYYREKGFWQKHPYIYFTTINEARTYEVVTAGIYDYIAKPKEGQYRFSDFVSYLTEEEFQKHFAYFKEHAEYDTGVEVSSADRFIMLVTCNGDHERFIVLARETNWVEP